MTVQYEFIGFFDPVRYALIEAKTISPRRDKTTYGFIKECEESLKSYNIKYSFKMNDARPIFESEDDLKLFLEIVESFKEFAIIDMRYIKN